jgi:hypothetical protein
MREREEKAASKIPLDDEASRPVLQLREKE